VLSLLADVVEEAFFGLSFSIFFVKSRRCGRVTPPLNGASGSYFPDGARGGIADERSPFPPPARLLKGTSLLGPCVRNTPALRARGCTSRDIFSYPPFFLVVPEIKQKISFRALLRPSVVLRVFLPLSSLPFLVIFLVDFSPFEEKTG